MSSSSFGSALGLTLTETEKGNKNGRDQMVTHQYASVMVLTVSFVVLFERVLPVQLLNLQPNKTSKR